MANESKPVIEVKVTLGSNTVVGMGVWTWTGVKRSIVQDIAFDSTFIGKEYGHLDGGQVHFDGNFKKDDTTGQDVIRAALIEKTNLTSIRFYVDSASYYSPNDTTAAGGGVPASFGTSHVKITTCDIDFTGPDTALGKISFDGDVHGLLRLN